MSKAARPEAGARRIDRMPLDAIKGARRNPKGHDVGAINVSVSRFGYVEPMVLDERTGQLVAGHGRLETLRAMQADGQSPPDGVEAKGGEWLVPVLRGWSSRSDAEAEAYLVASNRTGELGGWDDLGLAEMLRGLATSGDLAGTGYDGDDVDALLKRLSDEALVPGFAPASADEQGRLDQKAPVTCPGCGHVFTP